jgi:hypothetical protein
MHYISINKYRDAVQILQRGRDLLVESLADDILDQADDLVEGGFAFNEFLETQGTRLHFLGLLLAQLEQSADTLDEDMVPPPPEPMPKTKRSRKPRAKKLSEGAPNNGSSGDL